MKLNQEVRVPVSQNELEGNLQIPEGAHGIVLFVHGSGSSRFSPRNQFVAQAISEKGLATLLIDLLTKEEEAIDQMTRTFRFDISLLTERLQAIVTWLKKDPKTSPLLIGLFGSSTGAAAALIAGAKIPEHIAAIVSRGGRPDLAGPFLKDVKAPTLFIVGGDDTDVIALNELALKQLTSPKILKIIPGATHLFEEPGTLEQVARLAADWFIKYL